MDKISQGRQERALRHAPRRDNYRRNILLSFHPRHYTHQKGMDDILCFHLQKHLRVPDALQVNRLFSMLTKNPIVWKRFIPLIPNIQQSLAPLPPTKKFDYRNMSGRDIETIVSRAVSYDEMWKRPSIKPWSWYYTLPFHRIEDMALLPGGHFLVTSVHTLHRTYYIIIWALDHPWSQKPLPILFRETEVKAYALVAKYMTLGGQKGICTAFLRKKHKIIGDTRDIPENFEMGGEADVEDPCMPIKYECTTLFVSLSCIEELTNRQVEPGSDAFRGSIKRAAMGLDGNKLWHTVSRIRTGTQLGVVTLDVIDGDPYVCVLKRPNSIVFERLDDSQLRSDAAQTAPDARGNIRPGAHNSERAVLTCGPNTMHPTSTYHIWNFRVLPDTNQVFVFRHIEKIPKEMVDYNLAEMYEIPPKGSFHKGYSQQTLFLTDFKCSNVQISDVQRLFPLEGDESLNSSLLAKRAPPPLSIYLRAPDGLEYITFLPIEQPPPFPFVPNQSSEGKKAQNVRRSRYAYEVSHSWYNYYLSTKAAMAKDEDELDEDYEEHEKVHQIMRIIPGSHRALAYEIPYGFRSVAPPIKVCYGFQNIEMEREGFPRNETTNAEEDETINVEEAEVEQALSEDAASPPKTPPRTCPSIDFPMRESKRRSNLARMELPEEVQEQLKHGVTALCFDEETGRLVFATKNDLRLHIIDFSSMRSKGIVTLL
ncbi:hypothetical protein EW145_g1359 [Phellinidium pouzarii]|uniref:Uncharacterized protein n=1 Tax=Phellinidium pouzarii TaxID=167371 RepID=A0A4S4LGM6_9AGAM|nr:hypothetical protein EW145_g1359 [Phellinidium pouzarii]